MLRSLFAGVAGLKSHQMRMDVIGNNIANVNTTAFKTSRVTFQDLLSQTIRGATAATEGRGGINAVQIGLGVQVASVNTLNTQGSLQATGKVTDLAIQGNGFFILKRGSIVRFTRDGTFDIGTDNTLVSPANGYKLQGWMADASGIINTSLPVGEITIPLGQLMPASATTGITMSGNLDASVSTATVGTILQTNPLLAKAESSDDMTTLYTSGGDSLGLSNGDEIRVSGDGGNTYTTLTVGTDFSTLSEFALALQTALRTHSPTVTVSVTSEGSILITNPSGGSDLDIVIEPVGNGSSAFATAFEDLNTSLAADGSTAESDTLRAPAEDTDSLLELYDSDGRSLGLSATDTIVISGNRGNVPVASVTLDLDVDGDTLADLAHKVEEAFGITNANGAEVLPNGQFQITGDIGFGNSLSNITIDTQSSNSVLRNAFMCSQVRANDGGGYMTSVTVYDSLGNDHNLVLIFEKMDENSWRWQARVDGQSVEMGDNTITFTNDGEFATDGGGLISFDPSNGAEPVTINPDFSGITQFAGSSTANVSSQDGYAQGELDNFTIGTDGVITGKYTNGMTRTIGQVALARFSNPGGLNKVGQNMYETSPNSGMPQIGTPGTGGRGTISSGTLEMSNVDIAEEFTNMIITQRGFQTNARVITAADQMLEELVNLKR